jgi:O-Antigen ligase
MSYVLTTLVFVLVLGSSAWFVSMMATPGTTLSRPQVKALWASWVVVTLLLFLSRNSMVFLAGTVILMIAMRKRVSPLLLYASWLTFVPVMVFPLSGIGPINNLIDLSYQRMLVWVVLVPALLVARTRKDHLPLGHFVTDWLCLAYGILAFLLQLRVDSLTNSLRVLLYFFTDSFWIYYAFSRLIRTREDFVKALWALCIGVAATSLIAGYEVRSRWMLYDNVDEGLGLMGSFSYLIRSGTGLLRAYGSSGHPLILGLITTLAIFWAMGARAQMEKGSQRWWASILLACLGIALFASQARGMWVGAAAGWLVWVLTGQQIAKRLALMGMVGGIGFAAAMSTESGRAIIDTLPFIGTSDQENVTYREQLFRVSLMVIEQNFFFGTFNFFEHPLMLSLVQGQGIVDPVNVFIIYALNSGMVGFSLFTGAWIAALWGVQKRVRSHENREAGLAVIGRGHLAAICAMVVMITTTSLVGTIPMMIWVCIGLSLAYCRVVDQEARQALSAVNLANREKARGSHFPSSKPENSAAR